MDKVCVLCNEIVIDRPLPLWHHLTCDHPDLYKKASTSPNPEKILMDCFKNYNTNNNEKGE